mmetsp:Transcript_70291/g.187224  ORF Transcript_70291/g.187224 Transcript_70291/m.187224 type:complete len:223 (-) Transcript_70291:1748-2416(-)
MARALVGFSHGDVVDLVQHPYHVGMPRRNISPKRLVLFPYAAQGVPEIDRPIRWTGLSGRGLRLRIRIGLHPRGIRCLHKVIGHRRQRRRVIILSWIRRGIGSRHRGSQGTRKSLGRFRGRWLSRLGNIRGCRGRNRIPGWNTGKHRSLQRRLHGTGSKTPHLGSPPILDGARSHVRPTLEGNELSEALSAPLLSSSRETTQAFKKLWKLSDQENKRVPGKL